MKTATHPCCSRTLILALLLPAVLTGSPVFADQPGLTVSAAVSLKNVFEEMGKLFQAQNKGLIVQFNFGASGDLAGQIEGGAPADVFASAAVKDMDRLGKAGLIRKETRVHFASNSLVLIVPAASRLPIMSFQDLLENKAAKIAVGNPKTMPAGRYAGEVLKYFGLSDSVRDRLVFTENVRQVLDYTARGETDAGIVYSTDAMVRSREVRVAATAPAESHQPVLYPIAIVTGAADPVIAKQFIEFIQSADGRAVLSRHGFKPLNLEKAFDRAKPQSTQRKAKT